MAVCNCYLVGLQLLFRAKKSNVSYSVSRLRHFTITDSGHTVGVGLEILKEKIICSAIRTKKWSVFS